MITTILQSEQIKELVQKGYVPSEYLDAQDELYFFGGVADGAINSVAIFQDSKEDLSTIEFKYIYVDETCRRKGIAKELFCACLDDLRSIGINEIVFEGFVRKEDFDCVKHLLAACEMGALYNDRIAMLYARGHFIGKKSNILFDNIDKVGLSIEMIPDYYDERLSAFWQRKKETGIYLSPNEYMPEACVFGLMDNQIEAALCMKQIDATSVSTEGFYHSSKVKMQSQLLPFMMSKMVIENADLKDNIKNVYVVCKYESIAKAVADHFGNGTAELFKMKYIRRF